jgi:dihydrofolate reductase
MRISCIVAVSENGVIGANGQLPWRLPSDLRDFKAKTMGKPLILGRKTYATLKGPLPGRKLIVVSRGKPAVEEGVRVAGSLGEAIAMCEGEAEAMIGGGEEIYRMALPLADRVYLTLVHASFDGDAFFPLQALADFRLIHDERHSADAKNPYDFSFRVYERETSHHLNSGRTRTS